MRRDPASLYDAHAERLFAYCWTLVGRDAPNAVRDTFRAAVQHPPQGDTVLWMYALARTACQRRGGLGDAFAHDQWRNPDPVVRAAATLRPDHRESLVLWAGEWLSPPDIGLVLGIAPDTVRQLLQLAANRLEGAVLDTLMRGPAASGHDQVIEAFERGMLPRLLAERVPQRPPARLRDDVLHAYDMESTGPMPTVSTPSPLVVIGSAARPRPDRRSHRGVAGVAASAAAIVGLLAAWPFVRGVGLAQQGADALAPSTEQRDPAVTATLTTEPGTGSPSPRSSDEADTGDERTDTGSPVAAAPDADPAPPPPAPAPPAADPAPDRPDPTRPAPEPSDPAPPRPAPPPPDTPESPTDPVETPQPAPTEPDVPAEPGTPEPEPVPVPVDPGVPAPGESAAPDPTATPRPTATP